MRLYSTFASQIDFLKSHCQKVLAFNAERSLEIEDLEDFVAHLYDLYQNLTDRDIDHYFAKK